MDKVVKGVAARRGSKNMIGPTLETHRQRLACLINYRTIITMATKPCRTIMRLISCSVMAVILPNNTYKYFYEPIIGSGNRSGDNYHSRIQCRWHSAPPRSFLRI